MKVLIDMNLSPTWESALIAGGIESIHWSHVGNGNASDSEIMEFARANGFVIFTQDLDFGISLAYSKDHKPSVVQIRARDVTPERMGEMTISALHQFEPLLEEGALITIHPEKVRARILPL